MGEEWYPDECTRCQCDPAGSGSSTCTQTVCPGCGPGPGGQPSYCCPACNGESISRPTAVLSKCIVLVTFLFGLSNNVKHD